MGFGFVEYRKPEQAQKALKQLQVSGGSWLRSPRGSARQVVGQVSCPASEMKQECRQVHIF